MAVAFPRPLKAIAQPVTLAVPYDLDNSHWLLPGSERVQDVAWNPGIQFMVVPRIHNKQGSIEAARNFLSMP